MDFTHWKTDARLVSAYVKKSADTIDWLSNLGINFIDVVSYFQGAYSTWHYKDENGPFITDAIFEKAEKLGVKLFLDTSVKKILKENRKIAGVIAEDKTGNVIEVKGKAVLVSCGGFGGNAEMIKKYTGLDLEKNVFSLSMTSPDADEDNNSREDSKMPPITPLPDGDGLRMAWEAGAGESEVLYDTIAGLPAAYHGPGGVSADLGSFRQPDLCVNSGGERFINEEKICNFGFWGNAIRRQKDGCAYMIFDEDTNKYYDEKGWDYQLSKFMFNKSNNIASSIQKKINQGYKHLFMADSIEELCNKTGMDISGLKKTIDEYNNACGRGRDEIFFKSEKFLRPVSKPKFYAARFYLSGYVTLGGIKINHKTEVLSKDYELIPGLYAAGNDANTIYGDTYPFAMSGNTSGFAYNTGRMAGEHAAEYIKKYND